MQVVRGHPHHPSCQCQNRKCVCSELRSISTYLSIRSRYQHFLWKIHVIASYVVPSLKICFSHAKAIKKSSQFLTRRRTFLPRGFRFRKSFFMCTFLEVFLYRQLIMSARASSPFSTQGCFYLLKRTWTSWTLSLFSALSMKVGTAWKVFPVHLVALD